MKYSFSNVFTTAAAAVALLSGSVQAQDSDTVIQVFWITETTLSINSLEQYPLAGSIVTADASTTVVAFECTGSSIDPTACGTEKQTITFGSTTWVASVKEGNFGIGLDCSIAENTESASCTGEITAPEQIFTDPLLGLSDYSNLATATTAALTSTSYSGEITSDDFTYLPITITAGQDKLASTSAAGASSGGGDGNGAGTLKVGLGISGTMAGLLAFVMMAL